MTTPDTLVIQGRKNADYCEPWQITLGGQPVDWTGWTDLKSQLQIKGVAGVAITLDQVTTATQGLRILTPYSEGLLLPYIPQAVLAGVADGSDELILTGDLVGVDPEGYRRPITDIIMTVRAGLTQP